jgi:acid phosphatase type 7
VVTAAGDICGSSTDCSATASLVESIAPTRALTLGDNAYPDGSLAQFMNFFAPNWGRFKTITSPVTGNHEYQTANAQGYFDYFGSQAPAPYYSFNLGSWHLIALGSSAGISNSAGSAEEVWLRNDLAANTKPCILAYWHEPRFTSGTVHSSSTSWIPVWRALYSAGADLVLNGHVHNYERFAPQNPDGMVDPSGPVEIVAGTGGVSHYASGSPIANSVVRNSTTYGVLKLTLHASSYDFQFVPVPGGTFTDSGSGTCH